jgi:NAD+ synthase (glutamine-hydrolysing)
MKNKYGYVRVAAIAPELRVANIDFNVNEILTVSKEISSKNCQLIVFPELCITGYTCADLFFQDQLLYKVSKYVGIIKKETECLDSVLVIGAPWVIKDRLYNVALIIFKGDIIGIIPKSFLPNRNEFYEERWFSSGLGLGSGIESIGTDLLFKSKELVFSGEICEDVWAPIPPSSMHAIAGATVIFNLSASNALVGKSEYRSELIKQQSARTISAYIYASAGPSESTTDTACSGHLMICENGNMLQESKKAQFETNYIIADVDIDKLIGERLRSSSFAKSIHTPYRTISLNCPASVSKPLLRSVSSHPFIPSEITERKNKCKEIINIQALGLAKRLKHIDTKKVVIGASGGLDSTLALLVCMETFKIMSLSNKGIHAISMPGFGTSSQTKNNVEKLSGAFNTTFKTVSITESVKQHFLDIGQNIEDYDIVYENSQARERTQILMDVANKVNGIVVGTGNMSELALGWCTYNADHMSMYNVNVGVPKTLVRHLIEWKRDYFIEQKNMEVGDLLDSILNTPVSPELLPLDVNGKIVQKTEEKIGPYELHDFFLFNIIRYGFSPIKVLFLAEIAFKDIYPIEDIKNWLAVFYKRFFSQQFKRSCLPDGPKVGSVSLSPRSDWRMPSDACSTLWIEDIAY